MKLRFFILLFLFFGSIAFAQLNVTLKSNLNQYSSAGYNDIWGYVDGNGREYALLGVRSGTSIIDLNDPENPVEIAFIPGIFSVWRDIKVHGQHAYVVTEGTGSGEGLQIIDLSQLPTTATLVNTVDTWFERAHNIFIDDGYAYVIGTNGGGGMHILDLSDPVNPVRTNYYTQSGYIHDVYVWNDTVVACAEDFYDLVDVSDKSNPSFISRSAAIPGIYAHAGWMTEDKRYFYGTEEFNQIDITVWDLQDRTTWDLVVPSWQTNSNATVHNLFIKGDYAHVSYYSDGYVVLNISDPLNPFLAGQYDTPDLWGCYPYLPSGLTIVSDMDNGLYVLEFTPDDVPPTITHTPMEIVYNGDDVTISANVIDNGTVTDANLHYRVIEDGNTGNWNVVTDLNGPSGSIYEFIVPGQSNKSSVEYYLAAIDNNNTVSTLPTGGSGINPLGGNPPPTFFSYDIKIPGEPVILSFQPENDTTVAGSGIVNFIIDAEDTSNINLEYKWYKNSELTNFTNQNFPYIFNPNQTVPRTDTILVEVTNTFYTVDHQWLIHVDNPTGIKNEITVTEFNLEQNYPNPFNPSTVIRFSLPESRFVNLSVYNMIGQKVADLVSETMPSGIHEVNFDASNLTSGIYLARIEAGDFKQLIKMTLVK